MPNTENSMSVGLIKRGRSAGKLPCLKWGRGVTSADEFFCSDQREMIRGFKVDYCLRRFLTMRTSIVSIY